MNSKPLLPSPSPLPPFEDFPTEGMIYLVTGGSGFLGERIIRTLIEESFPLRVGGIRNLDLVVSESWDDLSRSSPVSMRMIIGDVTDRDAVLHAVLGCDVVIHTAGVVDVWGRVDENLLYDINVEGTRSVIDACVAAGTRYLVHTSSMEVVGPNSRGDPFIRGNEDTRYDTRHREPYPLSKHMAEDLVLKANGTPVSGGACLVTCALRPTGIYGEGHDLMLEFYERAKRCRNKCLPRSVDPSVEHGRVYVGNAAWMHVLAAARLPSRAHVMGGQAYFCYDNSPYMSYEDFNAEILGSCGVTISRVRVPWILLAVLARGNWVLRRMLRPFVRYSPTLNPYTLSIASTPFTVQTDKARRHFGYENRYSWAEAKLLTVRWVMEHVGLREGS
ncbi:nucleotide-sugar epimerase [Western grey kangaroopox virus]|uniref:3 beta-hydroxysteroid dehydrogenase/Delta 5-->4-isomerase n=1 Tax=Western grey kangaroopox virus TaxID=1566307 RepID=A0A2C9DSV6_9POXV|nr:nucleotide-sugar epimerase [Western grey kangaroopox virus]ATI21089.1 3 beta-hydroxysteroid dehydrogenase/delta 5->4 isomerase [Western grey kangaroopox virus]